MALKYISLLLLLVVAAYATPTPDLDEKEVESPEENEDPEEAEDEEIEDEEEDEDTEEDPRGRGKGKGKKRGKKGGKKGAKSKYGLYLKRHQLCYCGPVANAKCPAKTTTPKDPEGDVGIEELFDIPESLDEEDPQSLKSHINKNKLGKGGSLRNKIRSAVSRFFKTTTHCMRCHCTGNAHVRKLLIHTHFNAWMLRYSHFKRFYLNSIHRMIANIKKLKVKKVKIVAG